ncbi:FAD/NAD(P)-binding protein [Nocardia brasiliensis]|uniref:FAD/NAD(P)-binding protein n=1 Tax=Nocardia brasiliensis TaxID=37326 RepID=UPI0024561B6B|nr:FAD/NAD(P)-binding protein [Nocardia brasiliensis]
MISPATPEYPRAQRSEPVLRIAIVGVGPRGLSVFERICANARAASESGGIEVLLVDSTRVGTCTVWRTDQSGELLMNTVASQVTVKNDTGGPAGRPGFRRYQPAPCLFRARGVYAPQRRCPCATTLRPLTNGRSRRRSRVSPSPTTCYGRRLDRNESPS